MHLELAPIDSITSAICGPIASLIAKNYFTMKLLFKWDALTNHLLHCHPILYSRVFINVTLLNVNSS